MTLVWEVIKTSGGTNSYVSRIERAKVPGGWLVSVSIGDSGGLTFYPDPTHQWDGNSLP